MEAEGIWEALPFRFPSVSWLMNRFDTEHTFPTALAVGKKSLVSSLRQTAAFGSE